MTVRIREVDGADEADDLTELHKLTLGDTAPLVDFAEGFWWIGYDGDTPVAFAGLRTSKTMEDSGYLVRAGVLPAYRGQGLQKRLIRVRVSKARKLGLRYVITDTNLNPPSANSLIACGFKMFTPKHPWSFSTATYWIRRVSPKPIPSAQLDAGATP